MQNKQKESPSEMFVHILLNRNHIYSLEHRKAAGESKQLKSILLLACESDGKDRSMVLYGKHSAILGLPATTTHAYFHPHLPVSPSLCIPPIETKEKRMKQNSALSLDKKNVHISKTFSFFRHLIPMSDSCSTFISITCTLPIDHPYSYPSIDETSF